jgi:hypothetical protein
MLNTTDEYICRSTLEDLEITTVKPSHLSSGYCFRVDGGLKYISESEFPSHETAYRAMIEWLKTQRF